MKHGEAQGPRRRTRRRGAAQGPPRTRSVRHVVAVSLVPVSAPKKPSGAVLDAIDGAEASTDRTVDGDVSTAASAAQRHATAGAAIAPPPPPLL